MARFSRGPQLKGVGGPEREAAAKETVKNPQQRKLKGGILSKVNERHSCLLFFGERSVFKTTLILKKKPHTSSAVAVCKRTTEIVRKAVNHLLLALQSNWSLN